jgi:hypothetical protein
MPRTAWLVLGMGIGALVVGPIASITAAVLAHEHPFDRST